MRYDSWSYMFGHSVGLRNAKLYLLTLFWSSVVLLTASVACRDEAFNPHFTRSQRIFGSFLFLMVYLPAGLATFSIFLLFLQRIVTNRTYQERHFTARNPYDLGWFENMQQVLGKPTAWGIGWLLPFRVEYPDNAGLFYPVNIPVFDGKYGAMASTESTE